MNIPTNWRRWRLLRGRSIEQSHERSERPTIKSVMNIPTNWRRWRLLRGRSIEQSHERSE